MNEAKEAIGFSIVYIGFGLMSHPPLRGLGQTPPISSGRVALRAVDDVAVGAGKTDIEALQDAKRQLVEKGYTNLDDVLKDMPATQHYCGVDEAFSEQDQNVVKFYAAIYLQTKPMRTIWGKIPENGTYPIPGTYDKGE